MSAMKTITAMNIMNTMAAMVTMPTSTRGSTTHFGVPVCAATPARPRRGFTLIELLVVIGIVAVLLSLLLPVVQSLREASRATFCANNEHQVGVAVQKFAQANGRLPTWNQTLSLQHMRLYLESNEGQGTDVFSCPTGLATGSSAKYGVNRCAERLLDDPGKIVMTDSNVDEKLEWETSDLSTWNAKGPSSRHSGMVNVLFADGRVERLDPAAINPYLPSGGAAIRQQLWKPKVGCSPFRGADAGGGCPSSAPIVPDDLVVHLTFDDGEAVGVDSSGQGNHFIADSRTGNAAADSTRCGVLVSAKMDPTSTGAGFALRGPPVLAGLSEFTVCYWYKNDPDLSGSTLITQAPLTNWANGIFLGLADGTGTQWLQVKGGCNTSVSANATPPGSGVWTHYACAYDSSGRRWSWVNGSSDGPVDPQCALAPETSPCDDRRANCFGQVALVPTQVFCGMDDAPFIPFAGGRGKTGTFDDYRIYRKVLSQNQVKMIFDGTQPSPP